MPNPKPELTHEEQLAITNADLRQQGLAAARKLNNRDLLSQILSLHSSEVHSTGTWAGYIDALAERLTEPTKRKEPPKHVGRGKGH